MSYLITGGMGFFGSNLVEYISGSDRGAPIIVIDNLARQGSRRNLELIEALPGVTFYHADTRDAAMVRSVVANHKPSTVFHLAGQVAMTTSLCNPRYDFEVNVVGTLNVLEACREHAPHAKLLYSSSNKVYGRMQPVTLEEKGFRYVPTDVRYNEILEDIGLDPESPYGCSKAAAEIYVRDFHNMYGLETAVFRHSSIYGRLQYATVDQGWVGWFLAEYFDRKAKKEMGAADIRPIDVAGNGKQVRDLLNVVDACEVYFRAAHTRGLTGVYNLGGGFDNSRSILELFQHLEGTYGFQAPLRHGPERQSDQKYFVASNAKIQSKIDWSPRVGWLEGLDRNISWLRSAN